MTHTMSRQTHAPRCNKTPSRHLLAKVLVTVAATLTFSAFATDPPASEARHGRISPHAQTVTTVADQLWEWAELGYLETQSSGLLQTTLANAGFEIDSGVGGIPTAFTATFGNGEPVIGIMGEFDALPGISQAAVDRKSVV